MVSSPPDLSFLQDSSCQGTALDSDSTDPFPESWPSTERSSPSTSPGAPASAQDGESVIAKYIERFRHGQPSSRSQRRVPPVPPTREFWWLEPVPPSDSSTPKGGASPDGALLEEASPLLCSRGRPADISPPEPPDPDIHSLQERAARLLLRSESSLSSTVPVSSEGLHSTPESSTPDSDQPLPGPPHLSLLEPSSEPARRLPARIPPCTSSTSPEEDILFQWRLRRKMEQASQAVGSLPLMGWSTQLAWGPRMGDRAFPVRPGLGLVPGTTTWRSGEGTAFPSPTAQPEVRSNPEWAPTPAMLHQGMGHPGGYWAGHPLEVPFQSAEPAVAQSPKGVHVLGQLTSATTPSSTPRPEGGGGGAAEMWSFPEAQRGAGPADRPGSHGAQRGAGPADRPGSHGAQRGAGPADRPGSHDAQRGAGPADRPGSHDAQRGAGPADRPGSHDAQRGAGPADRPGSHDAQRGVGPADRPGSHDAQRGAGPADRPGSHDAQRGAWVVGTAQHIPKETPRPSKPQPLRGGASGGAPDPEATRSRRRRNRKRESSIHSALGQVISERMFSPPVSPLPCREHQSGQGVEPGSPPEQDAAPELPAPSSQHPQLLQLATRLLEEAEESDGAEFEEDPLLQVLRGQREDLRSQLRAVDVAVAQLVSQGVAEPMSEPPSRPR
ncbi:proline and serine-rich protein 3 [Emydura macquarii macquarii]|uniref:proline and serine-rich protein 3 n=1 Tax=Emydura macquarii macquarii TaxID=1129001 RepID=UPI003529DBA5